MKRIDKALLILSIIILLFLIILIYFILNLKYNKEPEMELEVDDYIQCDDMNISSTVNCLRNYVNGFYNFTERGDYIKTLEDIKEYGGDCYDYSILYRNMARELGFNAQIFSFYGDKYGHSFVVIWDNNLTAYCILDLLNYDCTFFSPIEEMEKEEKKIKLVFS